MKIRVHIAFALVCLVFGACLGSRWLVNHNYAEQVREAPDAKPSSRFLLGTDELGRDRLARLLYGGRVSLLLAPAAAAISTLVAAIVGISAGYAGGIYEKTVLTSIDLVLSIPWFFVLITVRSLLPLDTAPMTSVAITFFLLGSLGWAASARIICAGTRALRSSEFIVAARAAGSQPLRILAVQLLPNMMSIARAQFLISIPVFILAEANLSFLGLGVSEPMPSLGGLLRELENLTNLSSQPWKLAPLFMLVLVVSSFQILLDTKEVAA